jgi:hypothetical protein
MLILEFLRPNHGHEEIAEQEERDNGDNEGFHGAAYSFSQKRT